MPEPVQPEAVAVMGEQDAGAVVAEPDAAGFRADVVRVRGGPPVRAGSVFAQEQRAGLAAGDEAGQQVGGGRVRRPQLGDP